MTHGDGSGEVKVEYAAILLGATGNVGGHILHLLVPAVYEGGCRDSP